MASAAIQKITLAEIDCLADSWFKQEILQEINGTDIEFIDPFSKDGEYGIVAVHLTIPIDVVRLD